MIVKLKNLVLCNGDFYPEVIADMPKTLLDSFVEMKVDDDTNVYIDAEAIISFQLEPVEKKKPICPFTILKKDE